MATTVSTRPTSRKRAAWIGLLIIIAAVLTSSGVLIGRTVTLYEQAHRCPTEDSCMPEYDHGRWYGVPNAEWEQRHGPIGENE